MSRKKRILHIISSLEYGGAQAILYTLLEHMNGDQFEHYVIYFHDGPYKHKIKNLGISVYHVRGCILHYDFLFFIRLFFYIRRIQPDCIHTILWMANCIGKWYARILGIPAVHALHDMACHNGFIRQCIDRITYCSALYIAVSKDVAHSYHHTLSVPLHSITIIHNGIAIERPKTKQKIRSKPILGFADQDFILGSVGRFEPVKRYDYLLSCFAYLRTQFSIPVRLVLIGSGSQEMLLRKHAHNLAIENDVLFVIGKNAYNYYQCFDCFVQTSATEGISIALLEAMQCGIPCVVSNRNKYHPVITSYVNGILVPMQDIYLITHVIHQLYVDKDLRMRLIDNAYRIIKNKFCMNVMIQSYERLIKRQCSNYNE